MHDRIKSLEGRVRRVQSLLKTSTTPIVISKVSSNATSSVNTSIQIDERGNNSSDAHRPSKKDRTNDSSSSYVLYDQNGCSSNE